MHQDEESPAPRDDEEPGDPPGPGAGGLSDWWRPRGGGLDVWYATVTDRATGTGVWIHGEVVAPAPPADGADADAWPEDAATVAHGWAALFPPGEEPVWDRTAQHVLGALPADPGDDDTGAGDEPAGFEVEDLRISPSGSSGTAGRLEWDLRWDATGAEPLSAFPAWTWQQDRFPGSQVVPAPDLAVTGTVHRDGEAIEVEGHGQVARVRGESNAQRWAWLHADLGDGDLIELVTAVPRRRALRRIPPVTFLRLRVDGSDWPTPRLACWGLRAELDLPRWTVAGRTQGVEVGIEVHQPAQRCVAVGYTDPDGAAALCTNTERADLVVRLRSQGGAERTWRVEGTAHAEVGTRD